MDFLSLQQRVRKDPLGPTYLAQLKSNLAYVRSLMGVEHQTDGTHNAWNVPRGVFSMDWSGSAYAANPASPPLLASSSKPASGTIELVLNTALLPTSTTLNPVDVRVQLNFKGTGVATKPWHLGYKVIDGHTLRVYLNQLSSALGAGNTWAAADGSFDVAIHAPPIVDIGAWGSTPANHFRGDTLTEAGTDWNALVQAEGDLQAALTAAHSSAGVHNVREVAKAYASVQYAGGTTYQLAASPGHSSNVSSVSRTSTGVVVVTYSAMTTPTQCFVSPDYNRTAGGDPALYIVNAAQTSSTTSTIYIYKYDAIGKTWNVAESDFFFALHGG